MTGEAPVIDSYDALVAHLAQPGRALSPRLRQVAQHLLNHPEDAAIRSITDLARGAGVPVSTLTRFCKDLGLAGFADLQALFRERLLGPRRSTGALTALDDPQAVFGSLVDAGIATLGRLRDEMDMPALARFVTLCAGAERVHIAAGRGAFGVGAYCFYGFAQVGKPAALIDNLGAMRGEQLAMASPGDAVLAISFDSYTAETLATAQEAARRGLTVLAITDNELSPLAGIAAATLFVREARLGHFRSQVPAMVLCQSIIVSVGHRLRPATPE